MQTDVLIVAVDGVSDSSLALAIDIPGAANRILVNLLRRPPRFRIRVLSPEGHEVRTGSGARRSVDGALARARIGEKSLVVMPGVGLSNPDHVATILGRSDVGVAMRFLERAERRGAMLAAACSATFVLAETGLLDGHRATTAWWLAPTFRVRYPRVRLEPERILVASHRRITAAASLAQAELMLSEVSRLAGPKLASLVSRYLLFDGLPTQARFMVARHLGQGDSLMVKAEDWVRRHLDRQLRIEDLAQALGVGSRTLARRMEQATGGSPNKFVQRVRVEAAVALLETSGESFEEVSRKVGYADPAALRRLIRRETGRSPRELRAKTTRQND